MCVKNDAPSPTNPHQKKKKKNDDIKVLFHLVTPSYQNQVS